MIHIGIDPDINKSGVAIYNDKGNEIHVRGYTYFELYDYLRELDKEYHGNIKIYVEAGWINKKSNWHYSKNKFTSQRIAKNVGSNHEAGRKIAEMCEYLNINTTLVKPLPKIWKNGKISTEELQMVLKGKNMIIDKRRPNQDERDSAILLLAYM